MNRKELTEIRLRLRAEASAVTQFYGCYVNSLHQIISQFSVSTAVMSDTESEMYFALLRKTVSGTTGKNLVTVQMEKNGAYQRMLSDVRAYGTRDAGLRERFFREIIEHADMEGNYLILLAYDSYDVPFRSASGEYDREASAAVFSYFICALCPVIDAEAKLAYISEDREFRSNTVGQTAGPPAAGFMYPSFQNRSSNPDKALYYMKSAAEPHDGFAKAMFGRERPMVDAERREAFQDALSFVQDGTCPFTAVQSLFETMRSRTEEIKNSENPELDMLRPGELADILEQSGLEGKKAGELSAAYGEAVGKNARLMPDAVLESGRFRMETPDVKITVKPEAAALVKMRTIDGRRYILIPADGGVELNGISVF